MKEENVEESKYIALDEIPAINDEVVLNRFQSPKICVSLNEVFIPGITQSELITENVLSEEEVTEPDSSISHVNAVIKEEYVIEELQCAEQGNEVISSNTNTGIKEVVSGKPSSTLKIRRGRPRKICNPQGDVIDSIKNSVCDLCHKDFRKPSNLARHKSSTIHSVLRSVRFVCDVCNKDFSNKTYFKQHKLIHNADARIHKCDVCSKGFYTAQHLFRHKVVHSDIKKYSCSVCNEAFFWRRELTAHKFIHSSVPRFQCGVCKKIFKHNSNLRSHELVHTGIKKYCCPICNRAFSQSNHLSQHKLTHSGVKNYKCDLCDKSFVSNGNLTIHKLAHYGVKRFQCDVCKKKFSRNDNLARHKLIHDKSKLK